MRTQIRQKVTLRANAELIALVRQIAEAQGISPAGVMDRLLLEGLESYARGDIDFDGYLQPTRQGRYAWTVEISPNGLSEAILDLLTIT